MAKKILYNDDMKIALFGGSFDPVHREHVRLAKAAVRELKLDKLIVMPSYLAPHKSMGARASADDRLAMCRIAFRDDPAVEVSDFELRAEGKSYSYLTCRAFAQKYPLAERYFLVGADMLENFPCWRNPEDILANVRLVACGRAGALPAGAHETFAARFGTDFEELSFVGDDFSSTQICVALAFENAVGVELDGLGEGVLAYIHERGLYRFPEQERALLLEKEERRLHSYRVAKMACERAKSLHIPTQKALLAAMLHDCGKYVPLSSSLLKGFSAPENVPEPVLHQYTGAYLAQHAFGVSDEEILDAIRYHTSGKVGMSELGMLIFLADLLEEGRSFEGIEPLRTLFWSDLTACMKAALGQQLEYLKSSEMPIYPLTERAYRALI